MTHGHRAGTEGRVRATTGERPTGARTRERRTLVREPDGTLVDTGTNLVVDAEELLDDLKAGHRFRAHRRNGADCTVEVLTDVLAGTLTEHRNGLSAFGVLPLLLPSPPPAAARPRVDEPPDGTVVPLRQAHRGTRSTRRV